GTTAESVTSRRGKKLKEVYGDEIVLAGGAINTPQLLQLSGIGDAEHLNSLGIDPIVNLPGVGDILQDHLEVYIQFARPQPVSEQPSLNKLKMPWIGMQWMLGRKVLQQAVILKAVDLYVPTKMWIIQT